MNIKIKKVKSPLKDNSKEVVLLNESTIQSRKEKILNLMREQGYSSLIVYADKEHGSNFEYLTGFVPRFEEALQVLNVDGTSTLILGNENFNKVKYSRVESKGIKCSLFSLPNQPMDNLEEMKTILEGSEIDQSGSVGIVGWKMIPKMAIDYDIPAFIVSALKEVVDESKLSNATHLYIDPKYGARITNNANEIAHYEYGSSLASDGVLDALNAIEVGVSELKLGDLLNKHGQYNNVVTISAFGDRFVNANIYPVNKKLEKGDKVALTVGYRGGLSSRSGYAVSTQEELESIDKGYLNNVVYPYFDAYHFWLTNITIGKSGGEFYNEFNERFPQEKYGWELCPGHLTSNEEWMSSPFYEGSEATVKSGMLLQVDFIPIHPNHNGVSAESTVAIANEQLRSEIKKEYPALWERIESRRTYLKEKLNLVLSEEVLPMTSTLGYYRPFMLDKDHAVVY